MVGPALLSGATGPRLTAPGGCVAPVSGSGGKLLKGIASIKQNPVNRCKQ